MESSRRSRRYLFYYTRGTAGKRNTRLNARLITRAPLCSRIRTTAVNIYAKDSPYDHSEGAPGIPSIRWPKVERRHIFLHLEDVIDPESILGDRGETG